MVVINHEIQFFVTERECENKIKREEVTEASGPIHTHNAYKLFHPC